MKQRMVVTPLVLGLMMLGGGTAMAQDAQTAAPAPSYEPMPAADPVAAVNAWVDALVARQWSTLPALTCEQERDRIAKSYDPEFMTFFSRGAVEALYDALTVELAERSAAVASGTEDRATVSLGGTLTYSLSDDALRTCVDALAAESSPAPTADEKEQYLQGLRDSLGRQVLAPEIEVVAEGGGWLVCGDIVTQAEEPSPSDGGEAGTDQGGGDISAGQGGDDDRIKYLGQPSELVPQCYISSETSGLVCSDMMVSSGLSRYVNAITLFSEGWDGFAEYGGTLPEGLRWRMPMDEVVGLLGQPDSFSEFGNEVQVEYSRSSGPYSRLVLTFRNDALGRLDVAQ